MKLKRLMKLKKTWLTMMITCLLALQMIPKASAISEIPFTDVKSDDWFYADVCNAYNMALIDGRSETIFAPDDMLTYAETVKLAACMYQVYMDEESFVVTYSPWYQIYVDYCLEKGIINQEYPWQQNITRGAYMDIFSRALPASALRSINTVDKGMIPDVPMTHQYADSIYMLYRAGIVLGQDDLGTCAPESYVKRSEVAAILTRMMDASKRVSITLEDPSLKKTETTPSTGGSSPRPSVVPGGTTGSNSGAGTSNLPEKDKSELPDNSVSNQGFPWENGGKQPSEYTYEEFEALTELQKMVFQNTFGSVEAFDVWLQKAQDEIYLPWENGGKQPSEYTYAEFQALTGVQKIVFQSSFGSIEAFDAWLQKVQTETYLPWENGGKQPSEYTYEEFEALTIAQQMAFQNSFGSTEVFDAWLQKVQGVESGEIYLPWENGGKQPSEYTYEEFEALTIAQQMAFQSSFGSIEEFDIWLQSVQGVESGETYLPWENGGKQPSEYTYEEFEALTIAQQMAFQNSFGSIEEFDAWLQKTQPAGSDNPWENGGKQPKDYTWEEFEALTPSQQMAFQNSFGSIEEFDKWLTANQP